MPKATTSGWWADERRSAARWYRGDHGFPRIVDNWTSHCWVLSNGSGQH